MRVEILPSAGAGDPLRFFTTSFLIDGRVAVDAGALGAAPLPVQRGVRHVLLTHSHLDHLATLPVFLDNLSADGAMAPFVHGSSATIATLRRDLLNDRLWPDLVRLSREGPSFLSLSELRPEQRVDLDGLTVTPVPMDHVVPTFGYVIESPDGFVVIGGDTGPTERIWEIVRERGRPKIVFLEVSYPDRLSDLAEVAKHLTPSTFAAEAAKAGDSVRFVAVHVKPPFHEEVEREIAELGLPNVEMGRPGATYGF